MGRVYCGQKQLRGQSTKLFTLEAEQAHSGMIVASSLYVILAVMKTLIVVKYD